MPCPTRRLSISPAGPGYLACHRPSAFPTPAVQTCANQHVATNMRPPCTLYSTARNKSSVVLARDASRSRLVLSPAHGHFAGAVGGGAPASGGGARSAARAPGVGSGRGVNGAKAFSLRTLQRFSEMAGVGSVWGQWEISGFSVGSAGSVGSVWGQ
eukprot:294598-Chlamydomonas_euryale.AAC.1